MISFFELNYLINSREATSTPFWQIYRLAIVAGTFAYITRMATNICCAFL